MEYKISVLRQDRTSTDRYWQDFSYRAASETETVATALAGINRELEESATQGDTLRPIEWECSCLQKKCGACAMIINGRPRLACDARLAEWKNGAIRLEPLRKFPVICDLVVDRSILFENLKRLKLWMKTDAQLRDFDQDLAYESSECLQCGCCLEICPNFYVGGSFYGMATVPVTTRLLTEMPLKEYRDIARSYVRHTFEGCGKSLACKDVCPKQIDTEKLMVNANALALWKRKGKR